MISPNLIIALNNLKIKNNSKILPISKESTIIKFKNKLITLNLYKKNISSDCLINKNKILKKDFSILLTYSNKVIPQFLIQQIISLFNEIDMYIMETNELM